MSRIASAATALLSGVLLAGCGFTPLYASRGVSPALSAIQVNAPKGRAGFLIGEQLGDALATDRSAPPRYRLDVVVREQRFSRGLSAANVALRYETHVTVSYQLIELGLGKVITSGSEPIEVTYAAADQPYEGIAAQQDAQVRAAADAAQRIRVDLATFFAGQSLK